jgi:uncharacterized protein (TIGR00369 family)
MTADPADMDDMVAAMPFARRLGMTLTQAGPDRVVAELTWTPDLCTSTGVMHGGALMSLADSAITVQTSIYNAEGKLAAQVTQIQAIR